MCMVSDNDCKLLVYMVQITLIPLKKVMEIVMFLKLDEELSSEDCCLLDASSYLLN